MFAFACKYVTTRHNLFITYMAVHVDAYIREEKNHIKNKPPKGIIWCQDGSVLGIAQHTNPGFMWIFPEKYEEKST